MAHLTEAEKEARYDRTRLSPIADEGITEAEIAILKMLLELSPPDADELPATDDAKQFAAGYQVGAALAEAINAGAEGGDLVAILEEIERHFGIE